MPYISGMDKLLRGEGPRRGEWVSPFDISPEKKLAEPKPAKIEAAGLASKPAVIRAAKPDEIARDKEKEQQWAESKYSKMSGIDAALAYGSMKPKERIQLPEYVQWKLQNIYQSESENAKTAAESRYDGVGSSEADAFFRAYGDAANLYLPSIAAQLSGGDAAGKAKMGQLNQQRHPIISGVGEVLGWMTPSLSNAASTGFSASKPVKKLTSMAERGVAHGLGKLTGKSTFAAAHPNLMRVGTKALQGAASNAIMAGGSGTITGALQSAAKGNDAKTIASDALREGWDSAKYGAIGGGIRGGLHGWANVEIDPRLEVYRDDDAIRYTAPEKLPEYEPWMEVYRDDAGRLLLQDKVDSGIMEATIEDDYFDKKINRDAVQLKQNKQWYHPDGSIKYPPNMGAVKGTEQTIVLQPGTRLGRYGKYKRNSVFLTMAGQTPEQLSLPPDTDPMLYREFIVKKPIVGVVQSTAAPWFDVPGGGTQYMLPMPISYLKKHRYLGKVDGK